MKRFILLSLSILFCTLTFSQSKKDAKNGYCIDNDGKRYEGEFVLKHHVKNPSANGSGDQNAVLLYYKDGKKEEKFKPKDIGLLVLEEDTFEVITIIEGGGKDETFAQKVDDGQIQLYKVRVIYSYNGRQNAMAESFLWAYREKGESKFEYALPQKWSRKKFSGVISDYEELSKKVLKQDIREYLSQFPMTVKEYNDWFSENN